MIPYHSTALEQQALVKERSGRLWQVLCHNTNAATRFLHVYNLPRAVTAAVTAVAEVSTIDFDTLTGASVSGTSFLIYGTNGVLEVWFNSEDADPVPSRSHRILEVEVEDADDASDLAAAVEAALVAAYPAEWTPVATTTVVEITDDNVGARQNISAGDTGAAVVVTTAGVDGIPSPLLSLVAIVPVEADKTVSLSFGAGLDLDEGIVLANSTTAETYTAGSADSWFTALFE